MLNKNLLSKNQNSKVLKTDKCDEKNEQILSNFKR
jgi:hypothetical protein